MRIRADLHVHYYPHFNWRVFISSALRNLGDVSQPNAPKLLALTERKDCSFFEQLVSPDFAPGEEFQVTPSADRCSAVIRHAQQQLSIVAGWQINTLERLEVLALCCRPRISSGLSWQDTFEQISNAGGIAVINWAPGKWWFERGRLIAEILQKRPQTLLCETALRFKGYPKSGLFSQAQVLYGSDSLPLEGEEARVGSYGTILEGEYDPAVPGASLRALLQAGATTQAMGDRLSFFEYVRLMRRYYSGERK
jgi:hypothetical protein